MCDDLGRRLLDGLLDGQLERDRRRRAAVAAAEHPQVHDALVARRCRAPRRRRRGSRGRAGPSRARPRTRSSRSSGWRSWSTSRLRHQVVGGQPLATSRRRRDELEDPGQPAAVQLGDEADDLLAPAPRRGRSSDDSSSSRSVLDAVADRPQVDGSSMRLRRLGRSASGRPRRASAPCFSTLPLPRYMCTPQGRHGSKLRTARMMSMPLKLSIGFSSKIGVFITASS